jgi:hypothetical protein
VHIEEGFTQRRKGRRKAAKKIVVFTFVLLCAFASSFAPLRETL